MLGGGVIMLVSSILKSVAFASAVLAAMIGTSNAQPLTVVGTGDGLDMLRAVAAVYRAEEGKEVILPASIGSGGGIASVASGAERLARVARPLKQTERDAGLVAVPIAKLPTAIIVHPTVGVTELTSDQVVAIYAGRVTDWSEVGGKPGKIKVVRREEEDSSLQVLRASMPGWKDLQITSKSKTAVTTQDAIETVDKVEGAIGFAPYTTSLLPDATVLKIDGRAPTDPGYPSAAELQFVYKQGEMTPEAEEFVKFVRSDRGLQLLKAFGAVPSTD
jgi:phosphate transport system substrate-binding protein